MVHGQCQKRGPDTRAVSGCAVFLTVWLYVQLAGMGIGARQHTSALKVRSVSQWGWNTWKHVNVMALSVALARAMAMTDTTKMRQNFLLGCMHHQREGASPPSVLRP